MQQQTQEEYQAVRDAVGFLDLSDRGKIEITGPDRVTFLHSMISNDVQELSEWAGRYGTFLTARGKIVSDFFYYKFPDQIILDITADLLIKTVQTLEKYIVMDEVDLKDVSSDSSHFSLQGPGASNLVQELLGDSGPEEQYAAQEVTWQEETLWLIRKNELAESGFEMILPRNIAPSFQAALQEKGSGSGLREIGQEARDILRLEAAIPWYGVDMDENRYPVEARLDQAISYTKGCYLGQEVVAKATHVGGVSNLLMGLKIQGEQIPSQGSAVFNEAGKQIGAVTSAVFSPRSEGPIAFAYLKRAFAEAGGLCQVEIEGGESVPAEVVDKFF
jgi:folate-binding protein YgfZ